MLLKILSIRLGMNYCLYTGICIGLMVSSILYVCGYFFSLNPRNFLVASIALCIVSIIFIGMIFYFQRLSRDYSDQICTCRFRSNIRTFCTKCALSEENQQSDMPDPGSGR